MGIDLIIAQKKYSVNKLAGAQARTAFEKDWEKNLLYLYNKVFLVELNDGSLHDYSEDRQRIGDGKGRKKRMKRFIPANLMFSCFANMAGQLAGLPTDYICMPLSTQMSDEFASQISERLLNSQISPELEDIKDDLIFWIAWSNTSVIKLIYTKDIPILYPDTSENNTGVPVLRKDMGLNEQGDIQIGALKNPQQLVWWAIDEKGNKKWKTLYDGKITLSVLSPWEYYIDPLATTNRLRSKNKPQWIIQEKIVSREWVEINLKDSDIKINDINFNAAPQDKVTEILSRIKGTPYSGQGQFARYNEYWQLPDKDNKNGVYIRMVDDKVFESSELPEPFLHMEILPFISVSDTIHPYGWYGHTLLDKVRPYQKLKSIVLSKLCENVEKVGFIDMFAPMGDTITRTNVNSELIDNIFSTSSNNQPTPVLLDKVPMIFIRLLEFIDAEISRIYLHDIRFPTDKDRPLGETMAIIEQDERRLLGFRQNIIKAFRDIGEISVKMMQAYYPPRKQLRILGDEDIWQTINFISSDVRGNYDVDINMGKLPYFTPAGIMARMTVLQQLGIPVNKTEALRMLNMKALVNDPDINADVKHARTENAKILRANPELIRDHIEVYLDKKPLVLTCEEWENHDIDYKEHESFLKRYGYKLNSFVVQLLLNHMREVKMAQITKIAETGAMAQAAQQALQPQIQPTQPASSQMATVAQ